MNKPDVQTVQIIPLGGCGEFGMNMTLYRYGSQTFVVDAGSRFPTAFQSGIDCIIPDVGELFSKLSGVTAYIITHGHEDHIGALPYIFRQCPAPIFAPPWAAALIDRKFTSLELDMTQLTICQLGDKKTFGDTSFTWIPLNHSIPHACAMLIEMGDRKVFHTGDFKIDPDAIYEPPADMNYLTSLGDKGIDLLIADSTNAHKAGRCPSESSCKDALAKVLQQAEGFTVIGTFSSNLWRLMLIFELCHQFGKKLCVVGRGLENTLEIASELNLFRPKGDILIDTGEINQYDRKDVVLLATGCQGERLAGLNRIVSGHLKACQLNEDDQVIFSSRVIPGNELAILNITNQLEKIGCKIINNSPSQNIHVSGHGYREDLSDLLSTLRPRYFLPMHGSFFHLKSNNDNYTDNHPSIEKTFLTDTGDVFSLSKNDLVLAGRIDLNRLFIDQGSRLEMDYLTLKQRLKVGERGQLIFSGIYDSQQNKWRQQPQMKSVGVMMPAKAQTNKWKEKLYDRLATQVGQYLVKNSFDQDDLNEYMRIQLRSRIDEVLNKKPEVTCQIFVV